MVLDRTQKEVHLMQFGTMELPSTGWHVVHVPGMHRDPLATVNVVASKIEPKCASVLIRELNEKSPLPTLGHVKRVRRTSIEGRIELCIILCYADGVDLQTESATMPEEVANLVKRYGLQPFVSMVPEHEALTKEEWTAQNAIWPTSFHPNSCASLETKDIADEELQKMRTLMKLAIKQAHLAQRYGQPANGAVLVDPQLNIVVAAAHDETRGTSDLQGNICQLQTASGAALVSTSDSLHICSAVSCTASDEEQKISSEGFSWHPLRHAVMVAIERAAERDCHLFPLDGKVTTYTSLLHHDCDKDDCEHFISRTASKRQRTSSAAVDGENRAVDSPSTLVLGERDLPKPYLCTGYDAYITREPCAMCAMALVHQRVRRVIYGIPNVKFGALGSRYRLHGQRGLNHHYTVYQINFPEDQLLLPRK